MKENELGVHNKSTKSSYYSESFPFIDKVLLCQTDLISV